MADNAKAFRKKYNYRLDHLRGMNVLKSDETPVTNLLFTEIRHYEKNTGNVLLQGDSWAEQANSSAKSFETLKEFADQNKFGFVSAGVGSFAPSPMTIQLRILREDFNIAPNILIAIIDQTDVGDEVYRYSDPQISGDGRIFSIHAEQYTNPYQDAEAKILEFANLRSNKLALLKVFNQFKIRKITKRDIITEVGGDDILRPLVGGFTDSDSKIFTARLDRYIEEFFTDHSAKQMILVTHPHRNHRLPSDSKNKYRGDVSVLVKAQVEKSRWKAKITYIDFNLEFDRIYSGMNTEKIFKTGDPYSHLDDEVHGQKYLPLILKAIMSAKNG